MTQPSKAKAWLYAFRLRTLPLAFSCIITGSACAYADAPALFNVKVLVLTLITTLLLQILSNLANDYGDSEKGTDNADRIGPVRAVQSGMLSFDEIKKGIIVTVILSIITGTWLIAEATKGLNLGIGIFFFILGLGAIAAAIKYTVGKNAYGYSGLGDVFVLLFFGLVGVCGTYYLQAHTFNSFTLMPAIAVGAFASGVLNLNNMRDRISDQKAGKNTLAVKLGFEKAKEYHYFLLILGMLCMLGYAILTMQGLTRTVEYLLHFAFVITFALFIKNIIEVKNITEPIQFDPLLKKLALGTFFFSLVFAFGRFLG